MIEGKDATGMILNEDGSQEHPYVLDFDTCVQAGKESTVADISAIYFFYSRVWNWILKTYSYKLLYIGKSKELGTRLKRHAIKPKKFPEKGSVDLDLMEDFLCDPEDVTRACFYTYAKLDGRSLKKCEAALIRHYRPVLNEKTIKTLGCHEESWFTIVGDKLYGKVTAGTYHVDGSKEK